MIFPIFFVFTSRRMHQPPVLVQPAEAAGRSKVTQQTKPFNGDGTLAQQYRDVYRSYGKE